MENKVALITGAAQRIGAEISRTLHRAGYCILLHYRNSSRAAETLAEELNQLRPNSAQLLQADLDQPEQVTELADSALRAYGHIDLLVNNASTFYPTPIGTATQQDWQQLFGSNLMAPFFLSQALADTLSERNGAIVNLVDIHAEKPMKNHTVYCMAKAGLAMMTRSLSKELAPAVRVNGVSPGAILWPEQADEMSEQAKQDILQRVPMQSTGNPSDIAGAVLFLAEQAPYVTGQILAVDGGRSLNM